MKTCCTAFVSFVILLVIGFSANAQSEKLSANVKVYPGSLLIGVPTIQMGVELKKAQWGVQLVWGFNYDFYTMQDASQLHYYIHANKYRVELRRYRQQNEQLPFHFYGGALFTTIYKREMDKFSFTDLKTNKKYSFANGRIDKKVYGVAAKAGWNWKMGTHFSFELAPEVGARFVKSRFVKTTGLKEAESGPRNSINFETAFQGSRVKPHVGLAVSFNYRLF